MSETTNEPEYLSWEWHADRISAIADLNEHNAQYGSQAKLRKHAQKAMESNRDLAAKCRQAERDAEFRRRVEGMVEKDGEALVIGRCECCGVLCLEDRDYDRIGEDCMTFCAECCSEASDE